MEADSEFKVGATHEATVSMKYANMVALLLLAAVCLLLFVPYGWIWEGYASPDAASALRFPAWWLSILVLLASILLHELLHVVGFWLVGRAPRSAIRIGIHWKLLAAYAHCQVPLTARAYRISVVLPGFILGLVPSLLALAFGWGQILLWGGVMIVAAGGDLAALLAVRTVPGQALVRDHPEKVGCLVLDSPN